MGYNVFISLIIFDISSEPIAISSMIVICNLELFVYEIILLVSVCLWATEKGKYINAKSNFEHCYHLQLGTICI